MELRFNTKFNEIIRFVAKHLRFFSADEINLLARFIGIQPQPSEISSAILTARAEGLIERTERAKKSALYGKNSINRTIWKSLVGKEGR
jgi:hypothetical protein